MRRDAVYAFSYVGVAGQVVIALLLLLGLLALVGVRGPLDALRRWIWGYELWAGFVVASIATAGSLFYSEIANFQPCDLCWFQRICMYPMSGLLLLFAWKGEHRAARYLLALPIAGAGVSIYHMLIQYGAIAEPNSCTVSPTASCATNWIATPAACQVGAGCAVKWIDEFGYVTIPTIALSGFLLLIGFLSLASAGGAEDPGTLPAGA